MENIDNILNTTKLIVDKNNKEIAEKNAKGETYNIFNVLNLETSELMHSKMLCDLLDPNGEHGLRKPLLWILMKQRYGLWEYEFCYENAKLRTEVDIGALDNNPKNPSGGMIDILIEDNEGNAIIIENKVYAGDQCCQLRRYKNWADKKFKNYMIIYLTLDRSQPSNYSLGLPENATDFDRRKSGFYTYSEAILNNPFKGYITMAYEAIIPWINIAIREASEKPALRETLIQYRNTIRKITNNNMEKMKMELIDKLATEENIESLVTIGESLMAIKEEVFALFLKNLSEKIKKDDSLSCGYISESAKLPSCGNYQFHFKLKDNTFVISYEFQDRDYKNFIIGLNKEQNPEYALDINFGSDFKTSDAWFAYKHIRGLENFDGRVFKQIFNKDSELYTKIISETKGILSSINNS